MPIDLARFVTDLDPSNTVLFFGSGSSIPSGAVSAIDLTSRICTRFGIAPNFALAEAAQLAEMKAGRKELINFLRQAFNKVRPTGGMSNLPLYDWKRIYTTNYDTIVERVYEQQSKPLAVYLTNFDFSQSVALGTQKLYKLHGTIQHDHSDGHASRIVLTAADYDKVRDYREFLFNALSCDLAGAHLVVIGHSLADPDIISIVERIIAIQSKLEGAGGKVSLLLYERDDDRALLYESRGINITFGSVDDFFAELAKSSPQTQPFLEFVSGDPLGRTPYLRSVTTDARHAMRAFEPKFSAMYAGWPATYADIAAGFTFDRVIAEKIISSFLSSSLKSAAILGGAGVGKTTAARQVVVRLAEAGWHCWEHRQDTNVEPLDWETVARSLASNGEKGVLFVDEAHLYLAELNDLIERLNSAGIASLHLLLVSGKNHWHPRRKTPTFYQNGKEFSLGRLSDSEIDRLLNLVESNETINPLVQSKFAGFSSSERKRRLQQQFSADTFVCLKNIFSAEKFDDIILREYATLESRYAEIYKLVAAMENAGVRVHRQLVIRLLKIPAASITAILDHLTDIVSEYSISERDGAYGWRVRHSVIAAIIVRYKFNDPTKLLNLFEDVINCISPTQAVELRTIREMCSVENGIPGIADLEDQNRLLRKIISIAPGERVPRHRLIRNLIKQNDFDTAETEIRLFEKDLRRDGPAARYRIQLAVARAESTPGLLAEDRLSILSQAEQFAIQAIERFPHNRSVFSSYCDAGLAIIRLTGDYSTFDAAIEAFKRAEALTGDPEMTRSILGYERRVAGYKSTLTINDIEEEEDAVIDE